MLLVIVISVLCQVLVAVADKLHKRDIHIDNQFKVLGPEVQPHDAYNFSYQVQLLRNCGGLCGGTLISSRLVITAAHCVLGQDPKKLTVKAGVTDMHKPGQKVDVFSYISHRGYVNPSLPIDIAVLVLQQELDVSNLSVAVLPSAGDNFIGRNAEVSGWGGQRRYLTHTTIRLMYHNDETMMVGADPDGKTSTYHGDSGGPLVIRNGTDNILVGVVSAFSGIFSAHIDLAAVMPWVDAALEEAELITKVIDKNGIYLPRHNC